MSSTKNLVTSVYRETMNTMKNKPRVDDAVSDYLFNRASISTEDARYEVVKSAVNGFDKAVESILNGLQISSEESAANRVTDAQINSAKMIAAIAANPKAAIEKMATLQPKAPQANEYAVSLENLNVDGVVSGDSVRALVSQEAFDGQQLNNAIYFSIAYNIGASVQDEFGETLYPTIAVSPTESGISVSVEFVSLAKEYLRNKNGTPADGSDVENRIAVIKAIYNNEVFGIDTSAIVPVFRANENEDAFVVAGKYTDDWTTQEAIVTAPLKFGKALDILGLSQTDSILAKGTMDNTDAVDRAVSIKTLFFELDGELFSYDVTPVDSRRFFPAYMGHYKKLQCNFKMTGAAINTSNTKLFSGTESTKLKGLTNSANHTIFLQFNVSGELNTESGIVDLIPGEVRLLSIRDAKGELVTTGDAYTEIAALIAKAKLVGYVLDAKRTNTNARTRGVIVANEIFSYLYTVPFRSGVTCIKSLVNYSGTENDANRIAAQSQTTGFIISNVAVKTLVDHVDSLRAIADNGGLKHFRFEGIGQRFIDPYFREESVNLVEVVDSLESNKRDEDIRSNILQRVNNIAMDMIINSNYGPAFKVIKGNSGAKITIVIATDPNIARLIVRNGESEFNYGDRFKFKVVSTYNNLMTNKIIVVPTVLDANKNTTPDPLNFGFCAYTPTIVYEVSKTVNGAVANDMNTIPRFLHVTNLPIAALVNVSGVSEVFSKVALWTAPKARA